MPNKRGKKGRKIPNQKKNRDLQLYSKYKGKEKLKK